MNRLSIYFLTYNRIHENIFKSLDVISSFGDELKSYIDVYLVNDSSDNEDYEAELQKILRSKKYNFIKYRENSTNFGIIANYLKIVSECNSQFIQYICDDDYIHESIEDLLKKILLSNIDKNISSYFWKYSELRDKHIARTSKLMSFNSSFKTPRLLKFLFNQSDMYMHGIHNVKYLKQFKFSKFLLVRGPISWGYLLILNQLNYGKIIVHDINLWYYNSNSEKHYLRDNSKSRLRFFYIYLLREIELHVRYFIQSKNIFVMIFLPFIFINKILKRIL